jgi:hypothetical protein
VAKLSVQLRCKPARPRQASRLRGVPPAPCPGTELCREPEPLRQPSVLDHVHRRDLLLAMAGKQASEAGVAPIVSRKAAEPQHVTLHGGCCLPPSRDTLAACRPSSSRAARMTAGCTSGPPASRRCPLAPRRRPAPRRTPLPRQGQRLQGLQLCHLRLRGCAARATLGWGSAGRREGWSLCRLRLHCWGGPLRLLGGVIEGVFVDRCYSGLRYRAWPWSAMKYSPCNAESHPEHLQGGCCSWALAFGARPAPTDCTEFWLYGRGNGVRSWLLDK